MPNFCAKYEKFVYRLIVFHLWTARRSQCCPSCLTHFEWRFYAYFEYRFSVYAKFVYEKSVNELFVFAQKWVGSIAFVYIFVSKWEIGSFTRAHLITFYVIFVNGKSVFEIRVKPSEKRLISKRFFRITEKLGLNCYKSSLLPSWLKF